MDAIKILENYTLNNNLPKPDYRISSALFSVYFPYISKVVVGDFSYSSGESYKTIEESKIGAAKCAIYSLGI